MNIDAVCPPGVHKIILSGAHKNEIYLKTEIERKGDAFTLTRFTAKQAFHENIAPAAVKPRVAQLLGSVYSHYNAWDGKFQYAARVTKKGKLLTNRTADTTAPKTDKPKNRIFNEGDNIPALVDAGIFTHELKIASAKRDKFIQINRFVELLADETHGLPPDTTVNIIDFGCGKSYLTFLVYHYFTHVRGLLTHIAGLDTEAKLVRQCSDLAKKYRYNHLQFVEGDIGKLDAPPLENWGTADSYNVVISLHACNTLTDHTLYNAVRWKADLICAVPCCQHEARQQMRTANQMKNQSDTENDSHQGFHAPADAMDLFSRYGIVQERVASLATDAIRAALLEAVGYRVGIIELTDTENTAKNLLIRAAKTTRRDNGKHAATCLREVADLTAALGISPTLCKLLNEHVSPS
ncbi:MAG: SAM-dependent methyltransferase [Defluviitaleaceae bacterium]|nr:SAM-dependent methyltransferase [Defluviitaleaceae bacterium]